MLPLAVAALIVSAPAPSARPAADLPVPADAIIVVQLNGVERAKGRLEAMLKAAAPDAATAAAQHFDTFVSTTLAGRDLSTLAPDARVLVAVTGFSGETAEPQAAVLLPVKDFSAFRAGLLTADERKTWDKGRDGVATFDAQDKGMYAVELADAGYVAVTPNKDVAGRFAGKFTKLAPAQMGEQVADAFLGSDLAVYVNMAQVNDDYGDKMRQGRQLLQFAVQQGAAAGAGFDKRQMDVAKDVFDALFQSAEDARGLVLGMVFKPAGLGVRFEAGFSKGTPTADGLAKEQPGPTPGLGDLPAGQSAYSAGRYGAKLAAALAKFNQEFRPEDDGDKAAAVVAKYNELSAEATAGGFQATGSVPGVGLTVISPADPNAFVAARLKAIRGLTAGSAYMNVVLKEKPSLKEDSQVVEGFKLSEATLRLDFEATVKGIADANLRETTITSMKRMVNEKTTVWFGTDGKRVVTVTAADWPAAEKLLTAYFAGSKKVGDEAAFRATRENLPADASVVSLTDVGQLTATLSESFADVSESIPGFPFGKLPKLKSTGTGAAYLGFAIGLRPGGARFDLFVPAEAVKVVRDMVKKE